MLPRCAILTCLLFTAAASGNDSIPFDRLLREMADLASLAEFPDPSYKAARFSSYNRVSPADSVPAWYANGDWGGFLDSLPDGWLMMDAPGPGVVTHIWTALSKGNFRFYFDHDTTPSWTIAMNSLLRGTGPVKTPFSCVTAQGENIYFPIPYRKHCRIEYQGTDRNLFYHIDYRTYPQTTALPEFSPDMITDYTPLIDSIKRALLDSTSGHADNSSGTTSFGGGIDDGDTATLLLPAGPNAVTRITIIPPVELNPALLRQCVLEITFDSATYPQVRVPLIDFFAGMPRCRAFRTYPIVIDTAGVLESRWHMPYSRSATLRLVNFTGAQTMFSVLVHTQPARITGNTMYFNARWRQDRAVATSKNLYSIFYMADPLRDHPMLHISGKGVHVGTILQIWNRENAWWGEGDDKIRVDGEPVPSFLGTGTEDYFGYAWSTTTPFSHPYHAQPHVDGLAGFATNARYHISDPQPFNRSYDFDMEIQTAKQPTELDFGRAVLFYSKGIALTDHDTLTSDDLYFRESVLGAGFGRRTANFGAKIAVSCFDGGAIRIRVGSGHSPHLVTLRIFRLDGRCAGTYCMKSISTTVPIAPLSAGLYIAEIKSDTRVRTERFTVSR